MSRRRASVAAAVATGLVVAVCTAAPGLAAGWAWTAPQTVSGSASGVPWLEVSMDATGEATLSYLDGDNLLSTRPLAGTWSSGTPFGDPDTAKGAPKLLEGADGTLTAVWVEPPTGASAIVKAARTDAEGDWSSPVTLSAVGVDVNSVVAAANGDGDVVVAWTQFSPGLPRQVAAALAPAGQALTPGVPVSGSTEDSMEPRVAIAGDGSATVLFDADTGPQRQIVASRRAAEGSAWETRIPLADEGFDHQVAMDSDGDTVAVWETFEDLEGGSVLHSRSRAASAAGWTEPGLTVSDDAGIAGVGAALALRPDGSAVAAWPVAAETGEVVASSLVPGGSTWSTPELLREGADPYGGVELAVAGNGDVVATWTDRVTTRLVAAHASGSDWDLLSVMSAGGVLDFDAAIDPSGRTVVVWAEPGTVPDTTVVRSRSLVWDQTGPVTTMKAPVARYATTRSLAVRWSAVDDLSGVASYDVRYRSAPWNNQFGSITPWAHTTATQGTFTGLAGRTYCFSALARDRAANTGPWSAQRCTTTPLDDRSLARGSGWSARSGAGYFAGTFAQATTKGATLTRTGVQAKHLALLVSKAPGHGSVSVSLGSTPLGTYSLASATSRKLVVLPVRTFSAVRTGTLRVKVASSGRTVRVDGIYAGR